jgi:hypothetical protein
MPSVAKAKKRLPHLADVEHLDLAIEFQNFKSCVDDLETEPEYSTAHATCKSSRRILYALDEYAWHEGGNSPVYLHHIEEVKELFMRAAKMERKAVAATREAQRGDVRTFFRNITERFEELNAGDW